jgi:heat-inducible transcriptional repressor
MIDERSKDVLAAVIQSFIVNPEPVGSRFLTKKYGFGYSPATIRNIMADLEDMGFLVQPHTSAGRIPTDRGYRFYVENLMEENREYSDSFIELLSYRLRDLVEDMESMLGETARILSSFSNYISVALSPGPEESTLKRIELYPYSDDRIAVIIFTNEGIIKHKIIRNDLSLSRKELVKVSRYINRQFAGYTIKEIRDHLMNELARDREMCDTLVAKAMNLCKETMSLYGSNIIITGLTEMIELPDFANIEKIKQLSRTIDDKEAMVKLMDMIINSDGVQVVIGDENPVEDMRALSVIASTYREGEKPVGVIGIIGPKRMDYSSVISLVDTAARFLTESFEKEESNG